MTMREDFPLSHPSPVTHEHARAAPVVGRTADRALMLTHAGGLARRPACRGSPERACSGSVPLCRGLSSFGRGGLAVQGQVEWLPGRGRPRTKSSGVMPGSRTRRMPRVYPRRSCRRGRACLPGLRPASVRSGRGRRACDEAHLPFAGRGMWRGEGGGRAPPPRLNRGADVARPFRLKRRRAERPPIRLTSAAAARARCAGPDVPGPASPCSTARSPGCG